MYITHGDDTCIVLAELSPSVPRKDSFSDLGFENEPGVIEASAALTRLETTPANQLTTQDKVH